MAAVTAFGAMCGAYPTTSDGNRPSTASNTSLAVAKASAASCGVASSGSPGHQNFQTYSMSAGSCGMEELSLTDNRGG